MVDSSEIQLEQSAGCTATDILKEYPLEQFPNWDITITDRYYVSAPIDKLGDWAFHLRTHLTSLILSGNPAISFLQSFHSPITTRIAYMFTFLGHEEFFFSLVVSMIWLFDARLGRLLAVLLSLGFSICGSLKVAFCLPRPPIPPALKLSDENKDWAWPSNHALLGTVYPWFIWMYASKHYDLPLLISLLLLAVIFTWNCGVSWSRVYLGVHSPCDVLSGWTIGVLLLFVFGGFSDKLYDAYDDSSPDYPLFFLYFYLVVLFFIWVHPRAWPETQSYGEVVSVLSGTAAIWSSRALHIGGETPSRSLAETNSDAAFFFYAVRFIIGVALVLIVRTVVKMTSRLFFTYLYTYLDLKFYSYSVMCNKLNDLQPTKRFTNRMRFKPIPGEKIISMDDIPYDIDLPVKFVVYSFVGLMVSEGCPAIFKYLNI